MGDEWVLNSLIQMRNLLRAWAVLVCATANLTAQSVQLQDTLPPVLVQDTRFDRTGFVQWRLDSMPLVGVISLTDRLLWENVLDVRVNAPGTLATLSVRGAGPNRSPVFWNGLNLQSPMNGVVDVSLLPLWPDDAVEINYGGQSAAQSSGAMGGSLHIAQGQKRLSNGKNGFVSGAVGSFGRMDGSAGLGYAGKRFESSFRAARYQAKNEFAYEKQGLDGVFYPTKQVNNLSERTDFQQFNRLEINSKNTLKTAYWHQIAFREIPPSVTEALRTSWQRDQAHRAVATWESAPRPKTLWITRVAWLQDFLAFHLAGDTDTSRSRQVLLGTERSETWGKHLAWRTGINLIRQWAMVDGYADSTRWFGQTRAAGFVMGEWKRPNARYSVLLRQEWAEAQAAPFSWSFGANIGLGRVGEARAHFSRNFNLPTLNDRFWHKLGKPDLRPERGYSADLGWAIQRPNYSIELSGFQLILDDWILWQPNDSTGLFRPDNLRKVWSRGLEIGGKWRGSFGKWKLSGSGRVQFSRTTNVAVYGGSESALGRQLPYTPRASAGVSLRLSRGAFSMAYLQQFTGRRMDNHVKQIAGFQLGTAMASYAFLRGRISVDFRVENLWNTRYEVIRFRPMPGRAWNLGARLVLFD